MNKTAIALFFLFLFLIPVVLVTMLPGIIFGNWEDSSSYEDSPLISDSALSNNIVGLQQSAGAVVSEALQETLNDIDRDFKVSGAKEKVIANTEDLNVTLSTNLLISLYSAYRNEEPEKLSLSDMVQLLRLGKNHLYTWSVKESRHQEGEVEAPTVTRTYTVTCRGETFYADEIFELSEEEKKLALSYAQNLSLLLQDGTVQTLEGAQNTAGTTYEDITFWQKGVKVIYFNQLDARWVNDSYGTDTIGECGCGPTAMAIALSSLTGTSMDPVYMAQWSVLHGYWCSKAGSYHSLIPGASAEFGVTCTGADSFEQVLTALEDGKLVVALMSRGHFTSGGHFIVLRGITSDGKILVADPSSYERSLKAWDAAIIQSEASVHAGAGGPFWILSK